MSELSDKIRSEFKKADDERDALMNTPEDIERWDNIVYGHDDREMQRLDVYLSLIHILVRKYQHSTEFRL